VKHRAPARRRLPTEVPLDDGSRQGTETWREGDGVGFCHWDRWLLRLALEEAGGLQSLVRSFRRRMSSSRAPDPVAEAMLAQMTDLEARLTTIGVAPAEILDDVERASTWLRDKAGRRVWRATTAMRRTRKLLGARALSGNWSGFPVSPGPYLAELRSVVGDGRYGWRGTDVVIMLLDTTATRLLWTSNTDEHRLALHRAMLSVCVGTMEQVDDSLGSMGDYFREHEIAYLELLRAHVERPGILRDLLELVVWEDYGLFHAVEPFLRSLSARRADLAMLELARTIRELREAGLGYQLGKARALRRVVLAAAER